MHLVYPLVVASLLFGIGVYGVLARRNAMLVLMSVELMLNAVNLDLVAFDAWLRDRPALRPGLRAVRHRDRRGRDRGRLRDRAGGLPAPRRRSPSTPSTSSPTATRSQRPGARR